MDRFFCRIVAIWLDLFPRHPIRYQVTFQGWVGFEIKWCEVWKWKTIIHLYPERNNQVRIEIHDSSVILNGRGKFERCLDPYSSFVPWRRSEGWFVHREKSIARDKSWHEFVIRLSEEKIWAKQICGRTFQFILSFHSSWPRDEKCLFRW